MPKQNRNQPPPGRSQSKHNNRHSGIAKASHNSSSSALGAAIAAARTKHSAAAAVQKSVWLPVTRDRHCRYHLFRACLDYVNTHGAGKFPEIVIERGYRSFLIERHAF